MVLSAELPSWTTKTLQNIKIRHVAKYLSAINGKASLSIDMVDAMMVDRQHMPRFAAMRLPPGMHNGIPARWYEASIRSVHAEAMFARNATLEVGDAPAWTMQELVEDGAVDDLVGHAIAMMPSLVTVGCHNDNGFSAAWGLPAEEPEPDGFW